MTNLDTNDDLFNLMKLSNQSEKAASNDYEQCTSCNSKKINTINGQIICNDCGTIIENIIDVNPEWRYYGSEDSKSSDPNRCGMPTNELLPQSSCGSTVSYKWGESYEMKKIRNYHGWNAMPYKERSLYNVFDNIHINGKNHGITPCIIHEAKILYKEISEIQISRGANRKGIIAACIYNACKIRQVPRSHKEIAAIFGISSKHMTRGCKKFDELLNYSKSEKKTVNINGSNSIDFIQRFCSKLNLGENIYSICSHICQKAEEFSLVSENTPTSITAGSIYLICNLLNLNITKQQIKEVSGISEVTISKCYKKLFTYHKYLLPEEIYNKLY